MVPMLVAGAIIKVIFVPDILMPESRFYRVVTVLMLAVLLVFGVLRNVL
jgi:hypothetical protein